ncbi:PRE_C2HC domain-containing protein [Trichonephila clavipes]|nr:PRE_C2HC domain-containing protein [Trichonephila clavipes]
MARTKQTATPNPSVALPQKTLELSLTSQEEAQAITTGLEAMRKELSTVIGEIALIFCPVKDCSTHTDKTKNDSIMVESSSKINDNNSTEQNSNDTNITKEKAPLKRPSNNTKNNKDNLQNKKRTGQEDFTAPKKFARKIIEIPIEKVVCTSKNKFAVLENEEGMEVSPSAPTPKIKPIMMKINKNYNLILQEIYRSYPNTVNKNTGNYIKIQPATAEDQDKIKNLLIVKKADHYTIEHPTVIKAVIKGLPSSTNVTDIESELKAKGFEVEKIAQLRKFTTKSPLPLFMIQIKRSKNAHGIFKLNNLNYLTVEVVPFRRRPCASQSFNCNYFNHTSKNCKMTPRCLKCEGSHRTQDCHTTERLQTLHCINCNEDGYLASSRQCPKFPKLKLKQKTKETQINKTINQTRPVTAEISYANVCSNKTKQQIAPRGEPPKPRIRYQTKNNRIMKHQIF